MSALPTAIRKLPQGIKELVARSYRAAGEEYAGTGSFALDLPLSMVPKVKRGLGYLAHKGSRAAEKADLAIGEKAKDLPVVGRLFKGRQAYPIDRMAGDVVIKADIPVGRLTEPVRKSSRIGVPLMAAVGLESLRRSPKESDQMAVPKKASADGCGHEQLLLDAANKIREQYGAIEVANAKIASMELEKRASGLADRMVRGGVIGDEQRSNKVAELLNGKEKLATIEAALDMNLQPPAIPRIGVLSKRSSEGEEFANQDDEDLNETTQHLLGVS